MHIHLAAVAASILRAIAACLFSWLASPWTGGRQAHVQLLQPQDTSSAMLPVCAVLLTLRRLAPPDWPEMAPFPLEVLGLPADFAPLKRQTSPSGRAAARQAVRMAVSLALERARAEGDQPAAAAAVFAVAHMLLNDTIRLEFQKEVQPALHRAAVASERRGVASKAAERAAEVDRICGRTWQEAGWLP